jgi:hypothetical protein
VERDDEMAGKYTVECRLDNKMGNWNALVVKDELKWRRFADYERYDDMVKAIKDLNKNHAGLYEFRQRIVVGV